MQYTISVFSDSLLHIVSKECTHALRATEIIFINNAIDYQLV